MYYIPLGGISEYLQPMEVKVSAYKIAMIPLVSDTSCLKREGQQTVSHKKSTYNSKVRAREVLQLSIRLHPN